VASSSLGYQTEILEASPGCKAILTVRNEESWWESIKWHINTIHQSANLQHIYYSDLLHCLLFGTAYPHKYWYTRRAHEWNLRVCETVTSTHLLVLNIVGGDKWHKLCPFLGVDVPDAEWPWLNKKVV
jgi:hypothetical protein